MDAAKEREALAAELREVRERARATVPAAPAGLPEPSPVRTPEAVPALAAVPPIPEPPRPDNADLNRLWETAPAAEGFLGRVRRALRAFAGRQQAFNSRQVQFDNDLLAYVDARLDRTHRHYDAVLGAYARHMQEIDTRHLILQEELVAHVHDLVKRIDLVLSHGERGRLGLEATLQDVRTRLAQLDAPTKRG
ncbi:MAG: hypothetical protein ABW221_03140 [Vicinamibacteria bacterium]